MNTRDMINLVSSMQNVLFRLEVLEIDSRGDPFCGKIDVKALEARLDNLSKDEKGEIFLFADELEALGDSLKLLISSRVQFD